MTDAMLYKYYDTGTRSFANIGLPSGERIFLSSGRGGLAIFRMILGGRLPIRRLFSAASAEVPHLQRVLARAEPPPLPQATVVHRDEAQMSAFMDAAILDLKAVGEGKPAPGAVDALDLDAFPERPISVFARAALTTRDTADCIRLFERARNTPG